MAPAALRSRSMTQDVYERLRADILACRITPGSKLRINELCLSLGGVSLGAVREALSRLVADELVMSEPQRGFTVSPVSARDLEDLTAARIEVEGWCLHLIMPTVIRRCYPKLGLRPMPPFTPPSWRRPAIVGSYAFENISITGASAIDAYPFRPSHFGGMSKASTGPS
jgi:hypothetical protein